MLVLQASAIVLPSLLEASRAPVLAQVRRIRAGRRPLRAAAPRTRPEARAPANGAAPAARGEGRPRRDPAGDRRAAVGRGRLRRHRARDQHSRSQDSRGAAGGRRAPSLHPDGPGQGLPFVVEGQDANVGAALASPEAEAAVATVRELAEPVPPSPAKRSRRWTLAAGAVALLFPAALDSWIQPGRNPGPRARRETAGADSIHRGAAPRESLRESVPGLLRRRVDGRADHGPGQALVAAGGVANVRHAVQGRPAAASRDRAGAGSGRRPGGLGVALGQSSPPDRAADPRGQRHARLGGELRP